MTNCSEGKAGTVHPECVGEKHYSDDHGTGSAQKMSKAPDVDLQKDEGGAMPDTTVANALEKADSSDDAERHKKSAEMLAQRKAEQKNKKNQKDKARKDAKKKSDTPKKEGAPKEKPKPSSDGRDSYPAEHRPYDSIDRRTEEEKQRGDPIPESAKGRRIEEKPYKPIRQSEHKSDSRGDGIKEGPANPTKNAPSVYATRDDGSVITDKRKGQREAEKRHKKENKGADRINSGRVASNKANPNYRPPEDEYRVDVWDRLVGIINANNDKPGRPPIDKLGAQKLVARYLQSPSSLSPRMKSLIESGLKANEELNDTPPEAGRFLNENRGQVTRADIAGNREKLGQDAEVPLSAESGSPIKTRDPTSDKTKGQLSSEELVSRKAKGLSDSSDEEGYVPNKVIPQNASEQSSLFRPNGSPLGVNDLKERPAEEVGDAVHNANYEREKGLREHDAPESKGLTPQESALTSSRTEYPDHNYADNDPYPEETPKPRQYPLKPDGTPNPNYQKSADAKPPSFSELMKSKSDVRYSERGMPSGMHPYGHNFNGQAIPIQNGYRQVFIQRDEPVMPAPGKMKITKN